jgi:hypothetical protein
MHTIWDLQRTLSQVDVTVYMAIGVYMPFLVFASIGLAEAQSKTDSLPLIRSYAVAASIALGGMLAPLIVLFGNGRVPSIPSPAVPLLVILVLFPPIAAFGMTVLVFRYRKPKRTSNPKRVYSEEVEEIRDWLWYAQPFMDLESLDEEVKRQKAKRLADSPNISDESKDGA